MDFKDYEDAVQQECARNCKDIDHIISRNKWNFKNSTISVVKFRRTFYWEIMVIIDLIIRNNENV